MSLRAYATTITINTGIVGTVYSRDVGGQPVFAIFDWNGKTVISSASEASLRRGYGWYDGTNQRCVASSELDAATVGESDRGIFNDCAIAAILPGTSDPQGIDGKATASFTSSGVSLTVSDAFATALVVNCLIFVGTDITDKAVGTFNAPLTTVDSTVSLSFDPDVVGMAMIGGNIAINAIGVDSVMSFGAAGTADPDTGVIPQWVHCSWSDDGPTTIDSWKYMKSGECIASSNGTTALNFRGFMKTMAAGFVVGWNEVDGANQPPIIYFALKVGGKAKVGNFLSSTVSGTTQEIPTVGFRPLGLLVVSACDVEHTADTPVAHDELSVGMFGGTSVFHYSQSIDGLGTSLTYSAAGGGVYANYTSVSPPANDTTMTVSTTPNSFFVNQVSDDAGDKFIGYIAIGAVSTQIGPDENGNWYIGQYVRYVDANNIEWVAVVNQPQCTFGDTIDLSYLPASGSVVAESDVTTVPHTSTTGAPPYWVGFQTYPVANS